MRKINGLDLFLIIFLIILAWQLIRIANELDKESIECLANPLQFGYKKLAKVNNVTPICQCSLDKLGAHAILLFDGNNTRFNIENKNQPIFEFDLSKFITNQTQNQSL